MTARAEIEAKRRRTEGPDCLDIDSNGHAAFCEGFVKSQVQPLKMNPLPTPHAALPSFWKVDLQDKENLSVKETQTLFHEKLGVEVVPRRIFLNVNEPSNGYLNKKIIRRVCL